MTTLIVLASIAAYLGAGAPSQRRLARGFFASMERDKHSIGTRRTHAQWSALWTMSLWAVWPLCAVYVGMSSRWFPEVRLDEMRAETKRLEKENSILDAGLRQCPECKVYSDLHLADCSRGSGWGRSAAMVYSAATGTGIPTPNLPDPGKIAERLDLLKDRTVGPKGWEDLQAEQAVQDAFQTVVQGRVELLKIKARDPVTPEPPPPPWPDVQA
jgi:hypothetical protein